VAYLVGSLKIKTLLAELFPGNLINNQRGSTMNHTRPVFLKLAFTAIMLLWAGIAVTTATATSVTFAFTGVVSDVDPGLFTSGDGNNFNSGQKLSGFYTFQSTTPDSVTSGFDTNPTTPLRFRIALSNGDPLTFGDDSLPTTPPAISSFGTNSWRIIFQDTFSGQARILGSISSPLTAVPLPVAVILFGVGLIALVGLGAGSWQHRKSSLA
jgi:hypothetical protein